MSKPFWSKSSKNDDDDISSTHLFWSSLPQLEFDPSVTSFKSLLDIFWAGHDPTVPAYSRHVYNILHFLHFIFSNSQAVHVGNILPRRRATASCTRVDEICTDRPEERNPNCDPACRPFLPGRRVSLIHEITVKIKLNFSLPSYHQKYILQKHGTLLTSIGLSRGPKLVASSLAARLNGYLGGYGTKVLVFGFPCRCIELIDQCLVSCLDCDLLLSGGFSGRNEYCWSAKPSRHWLCCGRDRASYFSSLLEILTDLNTFMKCALLLVSYDVYLAKKGPVYWWA